MDGPPAPASRRGLVILGSLLAAGGAAYLWMINLAIVQGRDQRRLEELQAELMATREALHQAAGDAGFLNGATIALLKPNDRIAALKGAGGVVLHRGTTLFVAARPIPPPPRGKTYALWAYVAGKPLPAGEFLPGPDGLLRGRHVMSRDLGPVEGFALSLETPGNRGAPAGPVFLTRP